MRKPKLVPVTVPVEQPEPIADLSARVKALALKLNGYIQANGCSEKLKRKARQLAAEITG